MCMISYFPAGVEIDESAVWNGSTWNDMGHGWAIATEDRKILTGKSMVAELAITEFLIAREDHPNSPAMFHSRLATHGSVDEYNCHPFRVGRHAVVAHNGILPSAFHPKGKDQRSDTHVMADEWLQRQSRWGTWSRKERKMIGDLIGTNNKLVILSVSPLLAKPRGFLVNGHMGDWVKSGAWYSNGDYRYEWTPKTYGGTWMSGDGGYVVGGSSENKGKYGSTYQGGFHAFHDDECAFCFGKDTVNQMSNVCSFCHMCQDCGEYITDCLCYTPMALLPKKESKSDELDIENMSDEDIRKAIQVIVDGEIVSEHTYPIQLGD